MSVPRINALVGELGKRAPFDWAEPWDNVGLLAGDADAEVTGIVAAVNLGREALDACAKNKANVVVCHHPPIFKPVHRLTKASNPYLYEAITKGIAVIALHTNYDLASAETNGRIAAALGVKPTGPLTTRGDDERPRSNTLGKFITYVPGDKAAAVREAVAAAGGGVIGAYTQCSFSWEGQGSFLGGEGSNPTKGKRGALETTAERRLEMVFPWKSLEKIVAAARQAHPYEEMAYDILKLEQDARPMGYGFVGKTEAKISFDALTQGVKSLFKLSNVTVVENQNSPDAMKKIAFSPGSGSSFVGTAIAQGVDAYICGEVGYHQMLDAKRAGMGLIVLGHSYSERFFMETVARWCGDLAPVTQVFETIESHA